LFGLCVFILVGVLSGLVSLLVPKIYKCDVHAAILTH